MKLKYFVSFIIAMIGLGGLQGCKKRQDCVASNMQLIELPQYQSTGTPDFYFLTGSFSNNEFRLTGTNKNQQCEYSEERPNSCEFEIRFLPETNLTEGTTYRIGEPLPKPMPLCRKCYTLQSRLDRIELTRLFSRDSRSRIPEL